MRLVFDACIERPYKQRSRGQTSPLADNNSWINPQDSIQGQESSMAYLFLLGGICITLAIGLTLSTVRLRSKVIKLTEANEALRKSIVQRDSAETSLRKSNDMLALLGEVQRDCSSVAKVTESFDTLLSMALSTTDSKYGFIGECNHTADGAPYLKTFSITDISWNEETAAFYRTNTPSGMEFHNMDTLFGAVLLSKEVVIANAPDADPRSGGLPDGHPPLLAFMGLPFAENGELLGMIGIANRPGGYDESLMNTLAPLLRTCGHLIRTHRVELERERLRRAVEHADESILITKPDGTLQYVNPAFERATGYHRDEVLGLKPSFLRSGSQDPAFYQALWDTLKGGQVWRGQFVNQRKNGSTYVVDSTISPVLDRDGDVVNYVSVQRDITREQELEQMLLQSQKMEALGTLAGGVAHDFNNILQSIMGYAGMARLYADEGDVDESLKFCIREIDMSTQRATDLVDQILTFSRKADVARIPISLDQEISHALNFLRSSLPATIRIQKNISPDCPPVLGNSNQIHQLLTNLCTNAMQAMEDSGGILAVALYPDHHECEVDTLSGLIPPGDYVRLDIQDTGSGISPDITHRLLDPFFTTKDVGKGTGLGLAIVHGILSSMNAGLLIESAPGVGTCVSTFFPSTDLKTHIEPTKAESTEPPPGEGHVLVVDDEPSILQLLSLLLTSRGFTVETFDTAGAALEALEHDPTRFELALLDLTMPEQTGIDLANYLFAITPATPILITTGNLGSHLLDGARPENVREIVKKPFKPRDLMKTIRHHIAR